MRQKLTSIFAILIGGFTSLLLGSYLTENLNKYNNNFARLLPPHFVEPVDTLEFKVSGYSFSGFYQQNPVIQNQRMGEVWTISRLTGRLQKLILGDSIATKFEVKFSNSGKIYCVDQSGMFGFLQYGEDSIATIVNEPHTAWSLGGQTIVVRQLEINPSRSVLRSISVHTNSNQMSSDLLKGQSDGIFSTDGILTYSEKLKLFVYTYFYRNQFVCFDSTLHQSFVGNTIDTTTTAKISVERLADRITLSKPPQLVNRATAIYGPYLFVNSNLKSDNEQDFTWNDHTVVDVYDLDDNGSYVLSFYIPKLDGAKFTQFIVIEDDLFALYGRFVIRYKLQSLSK